MKDPTRLLDAATDADALELRLLRAGASEQPPPAALQHLKESLGVRAQPGNLPPLAAKKLGLVSLGIAAAGITVASVVWMTSSSSSSEPSATAPQPTAQSRSEPVPPSAVPHPASAPEPAPTLALEIARIDAIRQLLAAERAQPALAALRDYQRDFPAGLLQQEAEVLQIEAQRLAGERRTARVLAATFLSNHPDSPHSAHVRELLRALGPDAR